MFNQTPASDVYDSVLSFLAEPVHDFALQHRGNVFTLCPLSLTGERYAHEFFPRNPMLWFENEIMVPLADFVDVVTGIQKAGLTVGGAA